LGDALNAGYLYLEVRRFGCDTMLAAQTGNPYADLLFPRDSEQVRCGPAQGLVNVAQK